MEVWNSATIASNAALSPRWARLRISSEMTGGAICNELAERPPVRHDADASIVNLEGSAAGMDSHPRNRKNLPMVPDVPAGEDPATSNDDAVVGVVVSSARLAFVP